MGTDGRYCSSMVRLLRGREIGFRNVLAGADTWCPKHFRSHISKNERRWRPKNFKLHIGRTEHIWRTLDSYVKTCWCIVRGSVRNVYDEVLTHEFCSQCGGNCKIDVSGANVASTIRLSRNANVFRRPIDIL
ncbi:uncharacterized protein LOC112468921 [Temnothorax curvispinosus]|uniref:Uncharacterized protein LOC112459877 n=1 Tax=Temnothorax curvispinosus TaxID=300111 RepID=A0A6J1QTX6_9HYME|nr:uncharacterized protein LOC112459877 [Temnothorax curvispinosus]XP_024883988.1 uncharacterized protein LOC112462439 [Temnothorax curvispinosus]XP_024884075.1 uncharacterized protein LOC112462504 [Temnothorax curvispinosus]XP_024894105.1 uncharacterized protein LOC112468921 [Temnothorax curvispinosus]